MSSYERVIQLYNICRKKILYAIWHLNLHDVTYCLNKNKSWYTQRLNAQHL